MENKTWRIEVQGGGQITDTGDYDDPYYVLTDGEIELVTKNEIIDESYHPDELLNILNSWYDVKWEDWKLSDKEFELYLEKENCKKWKEALQLIVKSFPREVLSDQVGEQWNDIEELINNLP